MMKASKNDEEKNAIRFNKQSLVNKILKKEKRFIELGIPIEETINAKEIETETEDEAVEDNTLDK